MIDIDSCNVGWFINVCPQADEDMPGCSFQGSSVMTHPSEMQLRMRMCVSAHVSVLCVAVLLQHFMSCVCLLSLAVQSSAQCLLPFAAIYCSCCFTATSIIVML